MESVIQKSIQMLYYGKYVDCVDEESRTKVQKNAKSLHFANNRGNGGDRLFPMKSEVRE